METLSPTGRLMLLHFTKMQATGNDFVVVDNRDGRLDMDTMVRITPQLCHRTMGVGADGTLFLCRSESSDFKMVYRNADGSDAGMCGNGGRAISLFASSLGMGDEFRFEVHGVHYTSKVYGNHVELSFEGLTCMPRLHHTADGTIYEIFTGTEHIVLPVSDSVHDDLEFIRSKGRSLRNSELFAPKGTNVNFCTFKPGGRTILSTYERGVEDRTLACGTGSIATAIVDAHLNKSMNDIVNFTSEIQSNGGILHVSFKRNPSTGVYHDIRLSGEAEMVFKGQMDV
jgi:diaminopimelate epimerase